MKREVSFLWGTWYTLKLVSWYAGKGGWGIEAIYLRQYLTEFARQYQDSTLSLAPIFPIQSHNFISKCISSMANKQIERLSKVYFPILKKKKRVTSARGKLGLTKIFQKSVINIKRWLLYIYAWQIAIAIKKLIFTMSVSGFPESVRVRTNMFKVWMVPSSSQLGSLLIFSSLAISVLSDSFSEFLRSPRLHSSS